MPTLTIAFPAKFQIHARFAMTLISVLEKLRECQKEWIVKTHYILGKSNLSHARSVITTEWYETAADDDGFFFIDTDHTFTAEDILRVIGQEGDLNCGIYCNRAKEPVCYPLDGNFGEMVDNIPLKYAATGFLFFRKSTLVKIHETMKIHEGLDRIVISDFPGHIEQRTIPFFHSIIEPPRQDGKRFWLGEDFSFSWRAINAGLKIRGCITYTLGHEIPYIVSYDKQRRAPRTWHPQIFVIYAGNTTIPNLDFCKPILDRGSFVVVFSASTGVHEDKRITLRRYEEFHSSDTFSQFMLWGNEGFQAIPTMPLPGTLYAYLDKKADSMPALLLKSKMVFVETQDLYQHYKSLFPTNLILGDVTL
jgi:hypothetical protein